MTDHHVVEQTDEAEMDPSFFGLETLKVTVPKALADRLRRVAALEGVDPPVLVRSVLDDYIQQQESALGIAGQNMLL